jgi:hypothetical protein
MTSTSQTTRIPVKSRAPTHWPSVRIWCMCDIILLCVACFVYPWVHITKGYIVVIHNISKNCGTPFDHVLHLENKRLRIYVSQYWTYFSTKRVGAQISLHHVAII